MLAEATGTIRLSGKIARLYYEQSLTHANAVE